MSRENQTTSLSSPASRPLEDVTTLTGVEVSPTPSAPNASAISEYASTQTTQKTDSEPPPTYSSAPKWAEGPNSFLSTVDNSEYPAQLAITKQPGHESPYPQPQTTQSGTPSGGRRMPSQPRPSGCPRGLEYLTMVDQLLVHQKVELLEVLAGWESNNKYTIKNSLGQKVYTAKEDTDCCTRMCCGNLRPFDMAIFDNNGTPVLHLNRELRCGSCLCPCCLQRLEVSVSPGRGVIGVVEQEWTFCEPHFRVLDAAGQTALRIEGPFCTCSCGGDVVFEVLDLSGRRVGKITKQWSGLLREMFTDADHFGISFPMNLDVKVKATLLGALFLIDFMFFEENSQSRKNNKDQECAAACCDLCVHLAR